MLMNRWETLAPLLPTGLSKVTVSFLRCCKVVLSKRVKWQGSIKNI